MNPVLGNGCRRRQTAFKGLITFLPSDSEVPTQGAARSRKVNTARFRGIRASVPGSYKIVISSTGDKPETVVDKTNDMPGMPPKLAKGKPSRRSTTRTSILTAEVKAGGKNVHEFNLTNAPAWKMTIPTTLVAAEVRGLTARIAG